jgi:nucleoside-diphosphate-sugar epimerase
MKTVLITGVNGFLGSQLAGALARRGWRVRGTVRTAAGINVNIEGLTKKILLELGGPIDAGVFDGVDAVIHGAYDLRPGAMQKNIAGTQAAAEAAAAAGAVQQIFIGSYSAHTHAESVYGRSKYILQEYFLARGAAVARPGLVIGAGGLYARIAAALNRPVVPLPDGGRDRVPVLALADFVAAVAAILERGVAGRFNLYNPEPVTLRALVESIRAANGSRTRLAPVPGSLLLAAARAAAAVGVPIPFDAENFLGLKANQKISDPSDLTDFVAAPLSLVEMTAAAGREMCGELRQ